MYSSWIGKKYPGKTHNSCNWVACFKQHSTETENGSAISTTYLFSIRSNMPHALFNKQLCHWLCFKNLLHHSFGFSLVTEWVGPTVFIFVNIHSNLSGNEAAKSWTIIYWLQCKWQNSLHFLRGVQEFLLFCLASV